VKVVVVTTSGHGLDDFCASKSIVVGSWRRKVFNECFCRDGKADTGPRLGEGGVVGGVGGRMVL
jgi:hypothetical protein